MSYFPQRLDIHLGIAFISSEVMMWDILGQQLKSILKISKEIDNNWQWGKVNSMNGPPKKVMLDSVQSHLSDLFYYDNVQTDQLYLDVSKLMVELYSDCIYGFSNLGIFYLAEGDLNLAEKYLKQALKIDSKDEIVKENIKLLESLKKKKKKTIEH